MKQAWKKCWAYYPNLKRFYLRTHKVESLTPAERRQLFTYLFSYCVPKEQMQFRLMEPVFLMIWTKINWSRPFCLAMYKLRRQHVNESNADILFPFNCLQYSIQNDMHRLISWLAFLSSVIFFISCKNHELIFPTTWVLFGYQREWELLATKACHRTLPSWCYDSTRSPLSLKQHLHFGPAARGIMPTVKYIGNCRVPFLGARATAQLPHFSVLNNNVYSDQVCGRIVKSLVL